jgi:hypothetical protein
MYGLVNKAIQDMVVGKFGEAAWNRIRQAAGVEDEVFVAMEPYDDAVTYRLVRAASEQLGAPADSLLEAFGEFWTRYTAREGFGDLLQATGSNITEFLMNLDNMHARIGLMCPHLRPPSFRCSDVTPGSLTLHYYSEREGLAPMVKGLLAGLGKNFDVGVSVEHTRQRGEGIDHDEFQVRFDA